MASEQRGKPKMRSHTIFLIQTSDDLEARQYADFPTITAAMDGFCRYFEQQLERSQPNRTKFFYDVTDLFSYIDDLPDLACLVWEANLSAYVPHDKDWIKASIVSHLRQSASANASSQ